MNGMLFARILYIDKIENDVFALLNFSNWRLYLQKNTFLFYIL